MKKIISTSDAPQAIGPYSQGVRVGSTIYYSGQIPLDPKTGQIVSGDIETQARRVMENIGGLLKAERLNYDNIIKTTIFLADINDFQKVNEIYSSYFKQAPPARYSTAILFCAPGCIAGNIFNAPFSFNTPRSLSASARCWRTNCVVSIAIPSSPLLSVESLSARKSGVR